MSYRIDEIEGIGPSYAKKLSAAKVKTTNDFLKLCCDAKGRKAVCEQTGVSEKHLLKWANLADLMRIKGIGKQYSELLEASGVDTVKELRNRRADNLTEKMAEVNAKKNLCNANPSKSLVESWVEQAKKMKPLITH